MPRSDRTFRPSDVFRIYRRHLDAQEKAAVRAYFSSRVDADASRTVHDAMDVLTETEALLPGAIIAVAGLEDVFDTTTSLIADIAGDDVFQDTQSLLVLLEDIDEGIRHVTGLRKASPEAFKPAFTAVRGLLVRLRRAVRNLLWYSNLPGFILQLKEKTTTTRLDLVALEEDVISVNIRLKRDFNR